MDKTIFAYTPPGDAPPFLNLRMTPEGRVICTVRGYVMDGESSIISNPIAEVELPQDALIQLALNALSHATGGKQPVLMLPDETPQDVAAALNATLKAFWPVAQRLYSLEQYVQSRKDFTIRPSREATPDTPVARPQPPVIEEVEVPAERVEELMEQAEEVGPADSIATGLDNPANYTVEPEDGHAEAEEAGNQEVG